MGMGILWTFKNTLSAGKVFLKVFSMCNTLRNLDFNWIIYSQLRSNLGEENPHPESNPRPLYREPVSGKEHPMTDVVGFVFLKYINKKLAIFR